MQVPDESIQAAIRAARDQAEQVLTTATAQQRAGGTAADTWQALQNAWEELRASEDELARQSVLLEELSRQEPLLSIFDRAGAAVAVTDEAGRVVRATNAMRRLLGARDGRFLADGMPRTVARVLRDVLAQAKVSPGRPAHASLTSASGDSAAGWVLCSVTPVIDGGDAEAVWVAHLGERTADASGASEAVHEIAGLRATTESLQELLSDLSRHVVDALDGADGVSVTLLEPGSLGATSAAVEAADRLQYALQEGPCYDAMRTGKLKWTDSAHDDPRWPRLSTAFAQARAFRSILAVPLVAGTDVVGVLNVYATDANVFDETTHRIAQVLAGPVAATLTDARAYTKQSQLVAGLRQAVESHRKIGQAVGIIMALEGVDPDTAFARLRTRSNNSNRKLHEIAAEIVADATPR